MLSTRSLLGADGYFHLVIIKDTIATGDLRFYNPYSSGGKHITYPPGLHVLGASTTLMSGIGPELMAMLIPLILFTAIILFVYSRAGLLPAAALAFTPVFVWKTTLNFLPDPLWLLFALIALEKTRPGLLCLLGIACTHASSLFVIPFAWAFRKNTHHIFYVLCILITGSWFIGTTREVPAAIQSYLFEGLPPVEVLMRVGLPLAGLAAPQEFMIGFAVLLGLALLKAIELDRALVACAPFLCLHLPKNKWLWVLLLGQIALAAYMFRFMAWSYPDYLLPSMLWSRENTSSTLSAPYYFGYWVQGIAQKKNVLDGNWENTDSQKRYDDHLTILYGEPEQSKKLMTEYRSSFVLDVKPKEGFYAVFQDSNATVSTPG